MADTELGCPETRVFITERCGGRVVCDITDQLNTLDYGRVLDDTSEARITLSLSGNNSDSSCCKCVGETRSWLHAIIVKRDDELVWGPGPIVDLLYRNDDVLIVARDASAWFDARVIHNAHNFVTTNVLDIAAALIQDGMEPDDPCGIVDRLTLYRPATQTAIDKQYIVAQDYIGELLRDLAKTVLDYTTLGSQILMAEFLTFGPYVALRDEDFLVDLEVEERGIEAGTKWYLKGAAVLGVAGGIDPYMGLIEQLASDDRITSASQANAGAAGRLRGSNPPPVYVNVPDGAQLSPNAPVTFRQLVPGTLINIDLRNVCRPLMVQQRLTAVKVNVTEDGERVGVTLSPLGTGFDTAGGIEQP